MAELSEPGFWPLDNGDRVHLGLPRAKNSGSVVQVDGTLVILWDGFDAWQIANDWVQAAKDAGIPYRVERREWDLEPQFSTKYCDAGGNEVPSFEGTDLEPKVASNPDRWLSPPPASEDFECCASGSCEVCRR